DNRNTLSFDGGVGGGSFNTSQSVLSQYLDGSKVTDSTGQSQTLSQRQFRFLSGDISFKHNFQKEGHSLTADVSLRKFNSPPTTSSTQTQYFDNTGKPMPGNVDQKIIQAGPGQNFTGQLDYANPFTDKSKFEAGLRASIRNSSSTYDLYNLDGSGNYVYDSLLSTDFNYKESIYAAYAQYSNQINKFGYQLGLRAEDYTYSGSIPSQGVSFKPQNDKLGLYPSAFLTYKFSDYDQLQLNYTRRVDRPRFWQRFPYINYSNPLALTKGNPDLKPEYTNSLELNYNKIIGQTNFMVSLYYRNTNDMITTYTEPYNNSADTTISYSINANSNNVYGGEFTVQTQFTNWWNVTGDFNLFQTDINANVKSQNFSNSRFSWFGKVTSDMKLPANFNLQLQGNYNAPIPTPQGTTREFGFVDIGLKKSFFKKKNLTATLAVNDLFNTRKREFDYTIPNVFTQNSIEKPASRELKLNISYTFGKQDFSLFKRTANKSQQGVQQSGQDMQQGGGQY
ncbi:MAG: outer membrane beta-barrel family protein, partial [Chitinophagaceae bacterium]